MDQSTELSGIHQFPAPLRQLVIAKLRDAIICGLLKPGDRLIESRLTQTLKVSRPSLREAMRQLEAEGLIEIFPNRGPTVKVLTYEEAKHVYDLREVVEGLCARYFALSGSEEQIDRLSKAVEEVDVALKSGKREAIVQTKHLFYEAFVAGCDSELIRTYVRQLIAQTSYLWSSSLNHPGRPLESISERRHLAEAIRCREPEQAAAAAQILVKHASIIGLSSLRASKPR
jgi:GntR family transcriptional regulator, trigonelline degradation regulator